MSVSYACHVLTRLVFTCGKAMQVYGWEISASVRLIWLTEAFGSQRDMRTYVIEAKEFSSEAIGSFWGHKKVKISRLDQDQFVLYLRPVWTETDKLLMNSNDSDDKLYLHTVEAHQPQADRGPFWPYLLGIGSQDWDQDRFLPAEDRGIDLQKIRSFWPL